jgi:competence protein ComEA
VPVRAWIRDHNAEGRIARRVAAVVGSGGDEPAVPMRVARLRAPGRFADGGSRLAARFGLRLDPGRRAAAAVGVAALVAVIVAGGWVALNRPHAVALTAGSVAASSTRAASATASPSASTAAVGSAAPSGSPASAAMLVIDVVGKVARPGIYRLPAGSRVDDAVRAAGGAQAGVDLSTLNLAAPITDGEQIAVAVPGAPVAAAGSGTDAATAGGPVNLNTATAAQFDALPGVGPVLAQHIIDWRTQHGRFTSVDQLREVSGIGEAKFADLRSLVTV